MANYKDTIQRNLSSVITRLSRGDVTLMERIGERPEPSFVQSVAAVVGIDKEDYDLFDREYGNVVIAAGKRGLK
jgi:hypothetical protein